MSERKRFNPNDTKFMGSVGADGVVRLENKSDKGVEKKGDGIDLSPDNAKKVEQNRRIQTQRDLHEIFVNHDGATVTDESTDLGVQLMMQEQPGLITKCLNSKESDSDIIEEVAPGMARLGFDVANSGFGRFQFDTGDKKFDDEETAKQDKRFNVATRVFNQLIEKTFGNEKEKGLGEMRTKLDKPLCEKYSEAKFFVVRGGVDLLVELEQKIMDPRDQDVASDSGLVKYFNTMDMVIGDVGDALGTLSEMGAESVRTGHLSNKEQSDLNKDMLVLSQLLWNLNRKRKEIVRFQNMQSRAYDNMPPSQLLNLKESQEKSVEAMDDLRVQINNFPEPGESSNEAPKELSVVPTQDSGSKTVVIDKGGVVDENVSRELGGKDKEEKEVNVLTVEEAVKSSLKDLHSAKTHEEIIKNWTPETKRIFLAALLRKVDDQIDRAKYFAKKDPNSLFGAWSMASLDSSVNGNTGAVYQKAFIAESKKFVSAGELASMSVNKYFKDVFGYDLSKDKKRAAELQKHTNMLWPNAKSQRPVTAK